jgi:hypothetical protein
MRMAALILMRQGVETILGMTMDKPVPDHMRRLLHLYERAWISGQTNKSVSPPTISTAVMTQA